MASAATGSGMGLRRHSSVEEVFSYFVKRGLPEVATIFQDQMVCGEVLQQMSNEDLCCEQGGQLVD